MIDVKSKLDRRAVEGEGLVSWTLPVGVSQSTAPLLTTMIDFHTHILPALDDGAVTVDDSIAMAESLAAFGYTCVCCTPHCIKGYYDLTPQKVREATLMLQADLDGAGIEIELWPGMEYMLDESFHVFVDDLLPVGETRLVLCEAPPQSNPKFVIDGLKQILSKGLFPLIAHPERTDFFYEQLRSHDMKHEKSDAQSVHCGPKERERSQAEGPRSVLKRLWPFPPKVACSGDRSSRDAANPFSRAALPGDCFFQANLGSFTGFYGPKVQRNAYALLKRGVYTALASDLHDSLAAAAVLVQDKFENNPFLKKLAEFDGVVPESTSITQMSNGEQIGLF